MQLLDLTILKIHKNANLDFFDSLFGSVDNLGFLVGALNGSSLNEGESVPLHMLKDEELHEFSTLLLLMDCLIQTTVVIKNNVIDIV